MKKITFYLLILIVFFCIIAAYYLLTYNSPVVLRKEELIRNPKEVQSIFLQKNDLLKCDTLFIAKYQDSSCKSKLLVSTLLNETKRIEDISFYENEFNRCSNFTKPAAGGVFCSYGDNHLVYYFDENDKLSENITVQNLINFFKE